MKAKTALWIGLSFLLSSCIPSLQPLYTEDTLVEMPGVEGGWTFDGGEISGLEYWSFQKSEEKSYRLIIEYCNSPTKPIEVFDAHFVALGGRTFVDFYLKDEPDINNGLAPLIRTHGFAKVEFEGGNLKISQFDIDWLISLFEQRKIRLSHQFLDKEKPKESLVLTASTRALQAFVTKYGGDEDAYGDPIYLETEQ